MTAPAPSLAPSDTGLLVVGGGNAGLAAAVTAGELGIPTVVLEKTDRLGGQLHWSSGHFSAAGARRQRARGIVDTAEEHRAEVERMAGGKGAPHLIELATREAAAAVDWLESLDFPFATGSPGFVSGHELYEKPRTYWGGEDLLRGGLPLLDTLASALARHASVTVITGRSMADLVIEGGRVRGVILDDGARLLATRTVLATGGYAAGRELVAELQAPFGDALTGCLPHATGDGLRTLRRHGATVVAADTYLPTMGMIPDPDRPGFGLPMHQARLVVNASVREPWEIWVDRGGARFVDEGTPSPHRRERALREIDGLAMAAIWDEAIFRAAPPVIGPDWTRDDMLGEADRGRWLHRTGTVEELAGRLGVDPGGLRRTVREWNEGVDPYGRVHRPLPIRRPPFWGVRSVGGMLLSRGGPRVDRMLRPVLSDGSVLRSVHCVGELLGMGQFSGDNFAGGMSVGPALSLGRWLVRQLWEDVFGPRPQAGREERESNVDGAGRPAVSTIKRSRNT